MITFPNKPKEFYVSRLQQHMDADELIRNVGYKNGRGCAVGCILDGYDHSAFETELGLPEWLAYLIDKLHENTSASYWPTFAMRLLCAVPVGVDVEPIRKPLLIFMQLRNLEHIKTLDISDTLKTQMINAIEGVIDYLNGGKTTRAAVWSATAYAATAYAAAVAWSVADGNYNIVADELIRLLEELG